MSPHEQKDVPVFQVTSIRAMGQIGKEIAKMLMADGRIRIVDEQGNEAPL
jgi:hypothetical protein